MRRKRSIHQRYPGRAQRAASRRAGCPRAGPSSVKSSGGTPATTPSLEELGVRRGGRRCPARRRSGRRRSAGRPARARTREARSTRARSAPGRRPRPPPAKAAQSPIQYGCARDEVLELVRRHGRARARRAGPAQPANADGDCTASRRRRAGRAGGPATTTAPRRRASRRTVRLRPSRPPGSEVGCSRMPLERVKLHRV